jgi:drug/metabolite transporter (DMT)-like permease
LSGRLLPAVSAPLAAATTGVLVGATAVVSRAIVDDVPPASLALLRYVVAAAIVTPIALVTRRLRVAPGQLLPVVLLGICQFAILVLLLNWSLVYIPASRASLLFATMPLLTLVFGRVSGRESLRAHRVAGVLVTVAGVGLVLGVEPGEPATAPFPLAGELAALGSAAIGAVCSLLYRPYLTDASPLGIAAIGMLASIPVVAAITATDGAVDLGSTISATEWLAVAFIGASSAVGYLLWLIALSRREAGSVTGFLALGPLTATVLGALLLDEPLTPTVVLGTAAVALGLWLAARPTHTQRMQPAGSSQRLSMHSTPPRGEPIGVPRACPIRKEATIGA